MNTDSLKSPGLVAGVAALLDVKAAQVLETKQYGDDLVALVDYGIGGIKKYTLSLAVVKAAVEPEPKPAAEPKPEPEPEPAAEPKPEPEPEPVIVESEPAKPPKPRKGK